MSCNGLEYDGIEYHNEYHIHIHIISRLRLRTIISLTPEQPSSDLISFCVHEKIQNIHICVEKWNEAITMTGTQV